ncbi:hypothetical protein J6590_046533 [Homalodisca vitripennis]|nr:hypothetical protein J6590_046533 [Homalodisca vitripennis]
MFKTSLHAPRHSLIAVHHVQSYQLTVTKSLLRGTYYAWIVYFRPEYAFPFHFHPHRSKEQYLADIDYESGTLVQVLQSEYDDPLSTPRQKKPVSRTVGPRSRPGTHCPPLKKKAIKQMGAEKRETPPPDFQPGK